MIFNNKNISRLLAASLLAVLLFIHSIRLLHSHSYPVTVRAVEHITDTHSRDQYPGIETSQAGCDVCNYLLVKDSDVGYFPAQVIDISKPGIITVRDISFFASPVQVTFENRGPPSVA